MPKKIHTFKTVEKAKAVLSNFNKHFEYPQHTDQENSFIVKTIYEKTKRIPKDSKRGDIRFVPEIQIEQIYDIALLETPLQTKRVLPIVPATRRIPDRAEGRSFSLKSETPLRQPAISTDPILRTATKVARDTYRGIGAVGRVSNVRKTSTPLPTARKPSARVEVSGLRTSASVSPGGGAGRSKVKTISRAPKNSLRSDSSSRTGKYHGRN